MTEVLLKQTRAQAVAAMIEPFFELFPDPRMLGAAGPELERMLRPLGFSTQRAGQLRALGDRLHKGDGFNPGGSWRELPGIGPYSAGMVDGALGVPGAIAVDTNIARIIERVYAVTPTHAEARKSTNIWALVADLTRDSKSAIRVLWALLDLAATVCKVRVPDCEACPLENQCQYALGSQQRSPRRLGRTSRKTASPTGPQAP